MIRLARLDRDQGIHACLDTSGYASLAVFQRLAPLADLMLFDLKADHGRHRELTGLALDPILANLDWAPWPTTSPSTCAAPWCPGSTTTSSTWHGSPTMPGGPEWWVAT